MSLAELEEHTWFLLRGVWYVGCDAPLGDESEEYYFDYYRVIGGDYAAAGLTYGQVVSLSCFECVG